MATQPILLADLTCDAAEAVLAPLGVPARAARRIRMAAIRQGAIPDSLAGVADVTLARARAVVRVPRLTLEEKRVSPSDGFAKYLFRGETEDCFEAVRIPLLHRPGYEKYIVCVSSQAGCAMGCAFCATGRMGFRRDLATWEMVAQVAQVGADSEHPVGGVVFMGMGEPLLNYDAVVRAARIMSEPCGLAISGKAITISTAGIVSGIRRMTAERLPFRLVVSLTSADPARRREMMPIEAAHPTAELMESLRSYHAATRRRVTLAWIMISGVNTVERDAMELAALVKGLPVKVDLIDVNDPSGRFKAPSDDERNAFRDALRRHLAAPVARRYSGGADIHAACGMLAGARVDGMPSSLIHMCQR
jgi:23S rRNA (adenine2503-C2)-methyltransferase